MLGIDTDLGTLAYWRSHVLAGAAKSLRERLEEAAAAGDLEEWWRAASVADREALIAQVDVPGVPLKQRPWVVDGVQWGTRIPYVPLAAFAHAMSDGSLKTVADTADAYDITPGTTPWELLESLDDRIDCAPVPDDLPGVAGGLRLAFRDQPDDDTTIHNPVRWLLEMHAAATWDVMAAVAGDAAAKERARREKLAAERAARKAAEGA